MGNNDTQEFINYLIENESFIRWVRSEFQEDSEQWSDYIDSHEDKIDDINKAIRFVSQLNFTEDQTTDTDRLWSRIAHSAQVPEHAETEKVKVLFPNLKKIIALLAAACVMFVLAYTINLRSGKVVNTGYAQQQTEALPDGSNVLVNADSKITYNPKKWKEKRKVTLSGTAFFNVEKGSNFIVETPLGDVSVLGTSFSVTCRNRQFEVICKTGKVSVKKHGIEDNGVILIPGDKAEWQNGTIKHYASQQTGINPISWLEGVYTFENQPLDVVLAEVERQFDVKVSLASDLQKVAYTGFFKNNNLDEAIKSITWPLKLKYQINGKSVQIFL
jgi:ferric-dicitrate binding protein FerR (iron transport regulator)